MVGALPTMGRLGQMTWARAFTNRTSFVSLLASSPSSSTFSEELAFSEKTANENFKQRYKGSPNPYDNGVLKNIKEALFVKLPPSKVNFRAEIEVPCLPGEDEVCSHGNGQEAVG